MKTAITLSLLPSRSDMPFVLGPDLDHGFQIAAELEFDAVELFPPTLESIDSKRIQKLCLEHSMVISTIGTGGGAVTQGLTLTDPDVHVRQKAQEYVRGIIEIAGDFGGSAIIGSMQGKTLGRDRIQVLTMLGDALSRLSEYADKWDRPLFFEPLNRYESDLVNQLEDATCLIENSGATNAKILADLFHMNIEESDVNASIRENAQQIGHVHFVDSNRLPAGSGHTDIQSAFDAFRHSGFSGYYSVESFPLPDQITAATNAAKQFAILRANSPSAVQNN